MIVKVHLVVPEEIPNISKQTGLDEAFLWSMYNYDQQLGIITKLYIAPPEHPSERQLEAAFDAGLNYGRPMHYGDDGFNKQDFQAWYHAYLERVTV